MRKSARGFTLIELLVVIAIIAVIVAVVVIVLNPLELTRRSRDATRLSDLDNLQKAINVLLQDSSDGGDVLCASASPCTGVSHIGTRATDGTGWVPVDFGGQSTVQIPTLPVDPSNNTANHYTYYSDGLNYELNAVLESEQQSPKMEDDGGDSATTFETGTSLTLIH